MSLSYVIHESGPTPRLAIRRLNEINYNTVKEMGYFWHDNMREKHFTHRGATEYAYTPRNRFYDLRKLKTVGHTNPLEFSGRSRELSRIKDVRPTATQSEARSRVVLHAPALNFKPKNSRIVMRDEMTRVSSGEADTLGGVATASQQRQYLAITDTATKTIE